MWGLSCYGRCWGIGVKPNLFIVGAPKCGTTAWVEYLSAHPDIEFGAVKEPHYFCSDFPRMAQVATLDEYLALFKRSDARIVGEASVLYLYSEAAPRQIWDFNPDAKIIILLRNQEEFLPSFHNQLCLNFQESIQDFELAWKLSGQRTAESIPDACKVEKQLNYKDMGRFSKYSKRYFDVFSSDQIRVIHYDDWVENTRGAYCQILDFLGVEDDGRSEFPRINVRARHRHVGIARFLQRPPRPVEHSVEFLHKSFGVRSFGIAAAVEKLNRRVGADQDISSELKEEIRRYYRDDIDRLKGLISNPCNRPRRRDATAS